MAKKILTVDDSRTLRMIVTRHLKPFGVTVLEAENGEVAIQVAKAEIPDVILLDYNMPVLDGYHTLAELKAEATTKHIPVIMLTTETVKETVMKLIKLGLKDYVAKPFTREILLQKVNPHLQLYEGATPPSPEAVEAKAAAAPAAPAAASAPAKETILAVDDKESILRMLSEFLGDRFRVILAESGTAACSIINREHFDYMLLDLSMPDMSGLKVFEHYVKTKKNNASSLRVIAMTLRTAQSDINEAKGIGIRSFLFKPFTKEDVDEMVETAMAKPEQGESLIERGKFLRPKGNLKILTCPDERSPYYRDVAAAVGKDILREFDDMAEEGMTNLVIRLHAGFLTDFTVTRRFMGMLDHAQQLSLRVRLVVDSDELRERLKQFSETAEIPTDPTLEMAIGAFSS